LIAALRDNSVKVRIVAARSLSRMKWKEIVPALISALQAEEDLEVKYQLTESLGTIGDKRATPALIATIKKGMTSKAGVTGAKIEKSPVFGKQAKGLSSPTLPIAFEGGRSGNLGDMKKYIGSRINWSGLVSRDSFYKTEGAYQYWIINEIKKEKKYFFLAAFPVELGAKTITIGSHSFRGKILGYQKVNIKGWSWIPVVEVISFD